MFAEGCFVLAIKKRNKCCRAIRVLTRKIQNCGKHLWRDKNKRLIDWRWRTKIYCCSWTTERYRSRCANAPNIKLNKSFSSASRYQKFISMLWNLFLLWFIVMIVSTLSITSSSLSSFQSTVNLVVFRSYLI